MEELHQAHDQVPQENYVVISVFAGHGILKLGTQWLVTNEFDEYDGFYKLLDVEHKMRNLSEAYTNGYIITIFACCRELYDHTFMCGGIPKETAIHKKLIRASSMSPMEVTT